MHTTASDPASSGQIVNRTVAIRIGTAAVLIAVGLAAWGIASAAAPADAPAPGVVPAVVVDPGVGGASMQLF